MLLEIAGHRGPRQRCTNADQVRRLLQRGTKSVGEGGLRELADNCEVAVCLDDGLRMKLR